MSWIVCLLLFIALNQLFLYLCTCSVECVCTLKKEIIEEKRNTVHRPKQPLLIANIPDNEGVRFSGNYSPRCKDNKVEVETNG